MAQNTAHRASAQRRHSDADAFNDRRDRARAVRIEDEIARRGIKLRGRVDCTGPCPCCGGTDRFSINVTKQRWHCRGCKPETITGDVIGLVQWLDDCSFVEALATLTGETPSNGAGGTPIKKSDASSGDAQLRLSLPRDPTEVGRIASALRTWGESIPICGTPPERYLIGRGLDVRLLDDLSHCIRWHHGRQIMVALMTDPVTNAPTGIHRTFLDAEGHKLDRRMLGKRGVIRLSPDETVTMGLGTTEGIEDGLAVLLSGWAPVWAATCADAIKCFPLLVGIDALTVFADADSVGLEAATACVARYREAGRQACICSPDGGAI